MFPSALMHVCIISVAVVNVWLGEGERAPVAALRADRCVLAIGAEGKDFPKGSKSFNFNFKLYVI